jgi:hypothetical protein
MTPVILVDRMIIAGVRFVLEKVVDAVNTELNDDTRLRENLLAAQMKLELGELSQEEFDGIEAGVLARLREINEARGGGALSPLEYKITGADASVTFDVGDDEDPK